MSGFLFIMCSLYTYIGSTHIVSKGMKDGLVNIGDRGYKFDYKKFFKDKIKEKDIKSLGKFLPLIVPLVNLFYSSLLADDFKEEMQVSLRDYFIPFTDWEKNHYKKLNNEDEKFDFIKRVTFSIIKEEEEKVSTREERKVVVPKLKRLFLQNDRLKDTYTLDEVKRLNDTTGYLYRVGELDNKYVAIIGNYEQNPKEDDKAKIVEFLFEDEVSEHKFFPANELNLTDKRFIVYTMTNNEELENCVKEIKAEKRNSSRRKEMEELIILKYQLTNETNQKIKTKKR